MMGNSRYNLIPGAHYINDCWDEINRLQELVIELQILAQWMTGCGYDFSQHDYFVESQHLLSEKV